MALCNLGALMVLFGLKCNSVNRAGHDVRERPTGQAVGWPLGQALKTLFIRLLQKSIKAVVCALAGTVSKFNLTGSAGSLDYLQ